MTIISDNGVSKVWRDGDWIYKKQLPFLTANEIWCLERLYPSGYVPFAEQVDVDLIRLAYIERQPVSRPGLFMRHYSRVLAALAAAGIRHGDLTVYAVIPNEDRPYLIDFAESRLACDPRVDKRPEGDRYWLKKTMEDLCE